jgi:predicted RNase H-like HicB family nuclease
MKLRIELDLGTYSAAIDGLPGVIGFGCTSSEAVEELNEKLNRLERYYHKEINLLSVAKAALIEARKGAA